MKCVVCHGEQIEVRKVIEEISSGSDVVRFEVNVPVCRTCGERYYDKRTMQLLEQMEESVRRGDAELKAVGRVLSYV